MYGLLWRALPGNWLAKLAGCLVLFFGVVALLFLVVFPWVEPRLPWNAVTVQSGTSSPPTPGTPSTPSRSPTSTTH